VSAPALRAAPSRGPSGPAWPAIDCERVSFRYGPAGWAVRDVSLRVGSGEVVCLLGPNGAGKTTLVRQVTGQLRPASGTVRVLGYDLATQRERAREHLGVVPQEAGLFEPLTVAAHLAHFAALKGLPRRSRRESVASVATACALEPLLPRRVSRLSTGEKRRVLVALALLGDPAVLVLDEPTVGLDPVVRRSIWETLREQRARGRAILLTTHYLEEAQHLADRIAIVEKGALVRLGTLAELYAELGRTVRVSELDPRTGQAVRHEYFDTVAAAHEFVAAARLGRFLIGFVTLEDVYLRLFGRPAASEEEGG
jgi:ABC-2 type transport system ATP-binding protein